MWACDSRVQLEWNVFFFVLFPTKAHHYDFFNRKTFYSCCCFDASSWQTSDWCYFSWMFSEDGGVLGVVMLGQQKSPLKVPHFKSAKKTCRRKPKWDRSSDSCSGLTWASSLGERGGGVCTSLSSEREKKKILSLHLISPPFLLVEHECCDFYNFTSRVLLRRFPSASQEWTRCFSCGVDVTGRVEARERHSWRCTVMANAWGWGGGTPLKLI